MDLGKIGDGQKKPERLITKTPAEHYNALFEVRIARTPEDVRLAQRLRYRVYCEETSFLPADNHAGDIERDHHDARSAAILLIHRQTGACVGTVRIILPDPKQHLGGQPARTSSDDMKKLGDDVLPIETTGEISRFTIAPEFRRRAGDTLYQQVYDFDDSQGEPRRIVPYMALGLFAGIFEVVVEHNLSHLCAIIDPALLRMLRRLYLKFEPVGGPVEFHGMRQPVITSCKALYDGMKDLPEMHLNIVNRNGTLAI